MSNDENKNNFEFSMEGLKVGEIEIAKLYVRMSIVPMTEANQKKALDIVEKLYNQLLKQSL